MNFKFICPQASSAICKSSIVGGGGGGDLYQWAGKFIQRYVYVDLRYLASGRPNFQCSRFQAHFLGVDLAFDAGAPIEVLRFQALLSREHETFDFTMMMVPCRHAMR